MTAVVLILGILVGIAVASYRFSLARSYRVTCQMNQRTLNSAVLLYAEEHSSMPTDLAAIADTVHMGSGFARCPMDRETEYEYDQLTGIVTCPLHPNQ